MDHTQAFYPVDTLAQSDLSGAVVLTAVGVLVVFSTLVVLALIVTALGRWLGDRQERIRDGIKPQSHRPEEIDPHHLTVIAAAVAAACGPGARVHRIVMLGRESGRQWVTEGRVVVMGSHRPHH
ncbi:MAG: hypothetical protein Tsb0013_07220 [Phycisphaerales bacterium]